MSNHDLHLGKTKNKMVWCMNIVIFKLRDQYELRYMLM